MGKIKEIVASCGSFVCLVVCFTEATQLFDTVEWLHVCSGEEIRQSSNVIFCESIRQRNINSL